MKINYIFNYLFAFCLLTSHVRSAADRVFSMTTHTPIFSRHSLNVRGLAGLARVGQPTQDGSLVGIDR